MLHDYLNVFKNGVPKYLVARYGLNMFKCVLNKQVL